MLNNIERTQKKNVYPCNTGVNNLLILYLQLCNGNQYAYIKQEEMKAVWLRTRKDIPSSERFLCPLSELKVSGQIDIQRMTIGSANVPIQLENIPEPVINNVELFFCCLTCGKVYWEGSHFAKVCERFSHVLKT
jgi:hypothetical protein